MKSDSLKHFAQRCTEAFNPVRLRFFCFNTRALLFGMSCVKCRKEIISFLRRSEGSGRHGGGQDEVSSAMDWLVGSSQYQLLHKLRYLEENGAVANIAESMGNRKHC